MINEYNQLTQGENLPIIAEVERGKHISLLFLAACLFLSCSRTDKEYIVELTSPENPSYVTDSLVITLKVSEPPDSMYFSFLTSQIKLGSARSYSFEFNKNRIASGEYSAQSMFFWGDRQMELVHNLTVDFPVTIGEIEIPEDRITRNHWGSIVEMNLSGMNIEEGSCLNGLNEYTSRLSRLDLSNNRMQNVDLSELDESQEMRLIDISRNQLIEIPEFNGKAIKIDLSENGISTIDFNVISQMNVDTLNLTGNEIAEESMSDIEMYVREFKRPSIIVGSGI